VQLSMGHRKKKRRDRGHNFFKRHPVFYFTAAP